MFSVGHPRPRHRLRAQLAHRVGRPTDGIGLLRPSQPRSIRANSTAAPVFSLCGKWGLQRWRSTAWSASLAGAACRRCCTRRLPTTREASCTTRMCPTVSLHPGRRSLPADPPHWPPSSPGSCSSPRGSRERAAMAPPVPMGTSEAPSHHPNSGPHVMRDRRRGVRRRSRPPVELSRRRIAAEFKEAESLRGLAPLPHPALFEQQVIVV